MTKIAVGLVAAVILGLVASFLLPWQKVNWGRFQILPGKTITVIGQADSREKNQIARFSTGVNVTNDGKEKAIEEVSQKMAKIIDSVKDFGIAAEDIKTQNMSIYQEEERYWEEGREKSRPGQWRVSNQIDITLRDVNRTSALADLLAKSGANNVYGPNLGFEDTKHIEAGLLEKAIEDARQKAETIAKSSRLKITGILAVTEGGTSSPIRLFEGGGMGGGGAPIESGTSTVSKTVTVVFEIE